ncbi:flavin reductase family protein [Rhizobium halophytocola]|uniref:Flavin reductase (DIM6/NTAB) family NADH-FMN oxidoreductase RutF n=1 Tax=Rhizobium halophytocola TaxID=735519 RepID=A0ABS4E3D8_9HYPH|nr:flavin reductase family protein [Rhizobium halophytocola]MBP1852464.1 flavin reductase (DIM6/NTAB) family NADH-FMN oxidoreductase RutF [Rhizobium halophytocola]
MSDSQPPSHPSDDGRFTRFDFRTLSPRDCYKLLIGTVVPRPIAWITTVDRDGRVNAAPFSFFGVLSADPPLLAVGVENHADLTFKDTGHNIRATGEFTVNIVGADNLAAMNTTAVAFPSDVDELAAAGLTAIPGTHVKSPYIAEAPAAFECRRHVTLEVGASREIVLGEVLALHIRSDIVNERLHVDPKGLSALGRMGGQGYCRSDETFDLATPSVADWQALASTLKAGEPAE